MAGRGRPRKDEATPGDAMYVTRKLRFIKSVMDRAEAYLSSHPWEEIQDDDKRQKEMKLQMDLADSILDWGGKYMEACGILDVYRQVEESRGRKVLRAGQEVSGIQQFVRSKVEE